MARPAQPDSFDGAPSSWAALPADGDAPGDTAQMPQLDTPASPRPAPAPARHARARGRLQALLARAAAVAGAAPAEPPAAWPDSFFDVDGQP
jgi:hypothetical protein